MVRAAPHPHGGMARLVPDPNDESDFGSRGGTGRQIGWIRHRYHTRLISKEGQGYRYHARHLGQDV
eukprot:scaffold358_cov343-Pavlova_lutheri.AAC.50